MALSNVRSLMYAAKSLLRPIAIHLFRAKKYCADLWFDIGHGVHTRGQLRVFSKRWPGTPYEYAEPYDASKLSVFRRALDALPIAKDEFTFIDFGSGKGKVVILASVLGFRRTIGVELSPDLHRIAVKNIWKLAKHQETAQTIELLCCDASEFVIPQGPLVCYFYNPFTAEVMEKIMANLRDSLRRTPRALFIVYLNPVWSKVLRSAPWLRPLVETRSYCVYETAGALHAKA
jgi:hypothetical protein